MVDIEHALLPPGLYIVATPIGNLGDISDRARDILGKVNLILCEDTRVTGKLLSHLGVKTILKRYDDHMGHKVRPEIIKRIQKGESIALVSDAGMPLVSDPGCKLVREIRSCNGFVTCVPGPTSPAVALALSGLSTDRFSHLGFPPPKTSARLKWFSRFASYETSLVFMESPKRLVDSLKDALTVFGNRKSCVCRELTKLHEEVVSGDLSDIVNRVEKEMVLKGECIFIIEGAAQTQANTPLTDQQIDEAIHLVAPELGTKRTAKLLATLTGLSKNSLYERIQAMKL